MDYDYYENDGAYFRGRTGLGCVEDIWMGDGWEKYKGDCVRRYLFGNKVELANLPVAAGGEGRRPSNVWCEGDDWDAFLERFDEGIDAIKAKAEAEKGSKGSIVKTATTKRDEKPGLPIVAGKPYDEEDDFADSILRGIRKGIAQCKADEAAANNEPPKRRELPPGFREVGKPGDAWIIPGFPKP